MNLRRRLVNIAVLCILAVPVSSLAQDVPRSEPEATERLAQPILLPDCPGFTVVEWKTDTHIPWTRLSDAAVQVLNRVCELTVRRYPEFLATKGYTVEPVPVNVPISVLPANTLLDGSKPRSLNDGLGRFMSVTPRDKYGKKFVIWGVYDLETKNLFIRNDPVTKTKHENRYFVRVFAHELAHALNDKWGVKARYYPGDKSRDEELAEEWTSFIGYGFPDDSSFDDCYRKGFTDNVCIH